MRNTTFIFPVMYLTALSFVWEGRGHCMMVAHYCQQLMMLSPVLLVANSHAQCEAVPLFQVTSASFCARPVLYWQVRPPVCVSVPLSECCNLSLLCYDTVLWYLQILYMNIYRFVHFTVCGIWHFISVVLWSYFTGIYLWDCAIRTVSVLQSKSFLWCDFENFLFLWLTGRIQDFLQCFEQTRTVYVR